MVDAETEKVQLDRIEFVFVSVIVVCGGELAKKISGRILALHTLRF